MLRTQDAPIRSLSVYCQWLLYQDVRRSSPLGGAAQRPRVPTRRSGAIPATTCRLLASHALHGRLGELWRDGRWLRRHRDIGTA